MFTTRVDTLFGATFLAVAPEHRLVAEIEKLVSDERRAAIAAFVDSLKSKSELERTSLMEKQGIFTGAYAIHPLSGERVPIWLTNYVLAEYGSGAVMGVPAHDERDFDFATKHGLPVDARDRSRTKPARTPTCRSWTTDCSLRAASSPGCERRGARGDRRSISPRPVKARRAWATSCATG